MKFFQLDHSSGKRNVVIGGLSFFIMILRLRLDEMVNVIRRIMCVSIIQGRSLLLKGKINSCTFAIPSA